jgi:hypothetical protein
MTILTITQAYTESSGHLVATFAVFSSARAMISAHGTFSKGYLINFTQ